MNKQSRSFRLGGLLVCLGMFLLVLSGCDKISFSSSKKDTKQSTRVSRPVKGTVIAKVNNVPVTLEELNQEIELYNSVVEKNNPEAKISTREEKVGYLKNEIIRRLLLYNEALNRGLGRNEEVLDALEKSKRDILVVQLVKEITDKVKASAEEIEAYYKNFPERMRQAEERRVREIAVSSEQEANNILIELLQGADFATMAIERSKAPSKKNAGDLGYIKQDNKEKFAQFVNVAFSPGLVEGKISNVFKGPDGYYYIVKIEDVRGGQLYSLKDIWDQLEGTLTFVKQKNAIDELVNNLHTDPKFKVEIYDGAIK